MGCILVLLSLTLPRLVMVFIWLLTEWFKAAYDSVIWPILGFLFMPYTTLAYMAAMLKNNNAVTGWWWVLVIAAVVVDLGHWGNGDRARRRRAARLRRQLYPDRV